MLLDHIDSALETVMSDLRWHIARQIDVLRRRGYDDDTIVAAYREQIEGDGIEADQTH